MDIYLWNDAFLPSSPTTAFIQAKSLEELDDRRSLMECVRQVCPAMLVVLSWSYVLLANINMVSSPKHACRKPAEH